MRKSITYKLLSFLILFQLTIPNAIAHAGEWEDIDLTHKSPKDSVNWDNTKSVARPPAPAEGEREWPGEKMGLTGSVITRGGKGKDEAIVVYTPEGTISAILEKALVKKHPEIARNVLKDACSGTSALNRENVVYDKWGRIVSYRLASPSGESNVIMNRDNAGNIISITGKDQQGNVTVSRLNEQGEVVEVTNTSGGLIRKEVIRTVYERNEEGDLVRLRKEAPGGTKTVMEFNEEGDVAKITITDADGNIIQEKTLQHVRDSEGRLIKLIEEDDKTGEKIVRRFDDAGRVTEIIRIDNKGKRLDQLEGRIEEMGGTAPGVESVVDHLQPIVLGGPTGEEERKFEIKDDLMHHHMLGHVGEPYRGNWIVNTSDVPVEVTFIDQDGARTVIPEFRPGLATGIPLNATKISLHPVGEGNFSARIEKTDGTVLMNVDTPGTYDTPQIQPVQQPVTGSGTATGIESVIDYLQPFVLGGPIEEVITIRDEIHCIGEQFYERCAGSFTNTGDVTVEVRYYRPDGSWTVWDLRPGIGANTPPDTVKISFHPVGEGKFSGKIENVDGTLFMNVNTPGTYDAPKTQPVQQPITGSGTATGIESVIDYLQPLDARALIFGGGGSEISPTFSRLLPGTYRCAVRDYSYSPDSCLILQGGISQAELDAVVESVVEQVLSGKGGFETLTSVPAGVYTGEKVEEKESQAAGPNDPLYLRSGRKESPSAGLGGLGISLGGFSLGGGTSTTSKKKVGAQDQWGIRKVGFLPMGIGNSAWNIEDGSKKNVVVAVIDSGLDTTHIDGPQYLWNNSGEVAGNNLDDDGNGYIDDIQGWNFLNNNDDLTDYRGHGTLVAGIIAAKRNNNEGIAGINPGAQIMVLKVSNEDGRTNSLDMWRALHYAADKGAKIINISLGEKGVTKLEQLGINYAHSKGALVIVAAGNQGSYVSDYGPPAARRALSVAALNIEGTRSIISNFGPNIAIIAPGEDIYSLHSKDAEWKGPSMERERLYYATSGTSFSAPIVAGAASLMLAKNPALTNTQLEDILLDTATDIRDEGWDAYTGAGLLDAYAALKRAPANILILMPTEIIVNQQKNKVVSVDIFGIIRGNLDSYTVEVGRGEEPSKWTEVSSSRTRLPDYGFIARVGKEHFPAKADYTLRITARDRAGNTKTAQLLLPLKNK